MPENLANQNAADHPLGMIMMFEGKTYKVVKLKNGNEEDKSFQQIMDCTMDILAHGGGAYLVKFGNALRVQTLDFASSVQGFRNYVRPYVFEGKPDDIEKIVAMITENIKRNPVENLIILEDIVGKYTGEHFTFWIFRDHLLLTHKKGERLETPEIVPLNDQEIFQLEDKWIYLKRSEINQSLIPILKDESKSEETKYTPMLFLSDWLSQLHNHALLLALLGWFIATIHIDKIQRLRDNYNFPFFVLTAETEGGKTALLQNAMRFWGVNYRGENFTSTTLFMEMVEFAQVSCMPIWRDEYRNEGHAKNKEGWLRSVYTRSSSSRGRANQTVKRYDTKATLLLSGEDITEDPALYRRMLRFRLRKEDKVNQGQHEINSYKADECFTRALPMILSLPFNEEIFRKMMVSTNLHTPNDQKDEKMLYASLAAVFGEEIGLEALATANEYHTMTTTDIINEKEASADHFFMLLNSVFTEKGWWHGIYQDMPKVLEYFAFANDYSAVYFKFHEAHNLVRKSLAKDERAFSSRGIGQLIGEKYNAKREPRYFRGNSARVMIFEGLASYSGDFADLLSRLKQTEQEWQKRQTDSLANLKI